jgi:hypothetical protein
METQIRRTGADQQRDDVRGAFGAAGMKVTIEAVNAHGDTTRWWYTTNFDGANMPVTGNRGQTHAAVRAVSATINEIVNSNNGRVTQRLTNVLSPDGRTIGRASGADRVPWHAASDPPV